MTKTLIYYALAAFALGFVGYWALAAYGAELPHIHNEWCGHLDNV